MMMGVLIVDVMVLVGGDIGSRGGIIIMYSLCCGDGVYLVMIVVRYWVGVMAPDGGILMVGNGAKSSSDGVGGNGVSGNRQGIGDEMNTKL